MAISKNIFSIIGDKIICDVFEKQLTSEKDTEGKKIFICRNCFSRDFGGYPVYDESGICIGINRYAIRSKPE